MLLTSSVIASYVSDALFSKTLHSERFVLAEMGLKVISNNKVQIIQYMTFN